MTTEALPSSPCHPVTPSPCPSPPTPSVDTLLKLLAEGHIDIDDLCAQLACTPESLEAALDSKPCADRLRLKTKLAQTAMKLQVIKLVPKSVARLDALSDSDKPEVARRAATTLLNLNGIPTLSPKPAPWEPQPPGIVLETRVENEVLSKGIKLAINAALNYPHGLTVDEINAILEKPHPDGSAPLLTRIGPDD